MNKKLKLTFVLLFIVIFLPLQAQDNSEGIRFITDQSISSVLQKSKIENKLIFVDTYADWCGPCKKLAAETFPQKEVGDFFNANLINVKYDAEKGEGIKFYEKYKTAIPGFPTMLLINGDGEVVHSIVGFRKGDHLIKEVESALSGKTITSLERKYKDGDRSIELIKDYYIALKKAYRNDDAKKVVEEYRADLPVESLLDPDIWEMSKDYVVNPFSGDYQFIVNNLYKFEVSLKENMPALERQLHRSIHRAVSGILPQYQKKTVSQSTIDSVLVLKKILDKNVLKGSPDMLGKLKIAEYISNDEPLNVFNFMSFAHDISLYRHEGVYLQSVYAYIAENIDDPQILKSSLNFANSLQDEENKTSLPANFYSSIALMNKKLGDNIAAESAQKKYQELEERMQEKFSDLIKIFGGEKNK